MALMRHTLRLFALAGGLLSLASALAAQAGTGAIEMTARVTPTGARPEPVRQFTFYVLTKSYADIIKEVEGQNALPTRDEFIDKLTVSPELKKWLKAHEVIDLTLPDLDKVVTADDIMQVPEFFDAYERAGSPWASPNLNTATRTRPRIRINIKNKKTNFFPPPGNSLKRILLPFRALS